MAFRFRPLAKPSLQKVFFANAKELPNWTVAAKVRCEGSERVKAVTDTGRFPRSKRCRTERADEDILGLQEIFQIF